MENVIHNFASRRTDDTKVLIVCSVLFLFVFWALARTLFFSGLNGFDDIHYIRYALQWDRLPVDHWEARVLFNLLLRYCFSLFGFSEFVSTLPTLFASLVFMYCVFYVGLHLYPIRYAFFAAFFAAILPLDVYGSTSLKVLAFGNMFAALGTACILTARKNLQYVLAGFFLGISIVIHFALVFYPGILAIVLWGHKWPELQWKKCMLVIATTILVFALVNFTTFFWLTGDPLYQFRLVSEIVDRSYIPGRPYHIYNFYWFIWPIQNLVISKAFGILISFPILFCLYHWKRQSSTTRFLCIVILLEWVWINYGTIKPFEFKPLAHTTRYWYPLALPACILATQAFLALKEKVFRAVYLGATVGLPLLALSSSGSWGQNVEITKELMAYASKHPDTTFVTDLYTLNEMYILNGAKPPNNIFSIKNFEQPGFFNIPEKYQQDPNNRKIMFLYNKQNMWRPFAAEFKEYVANNVQLSEISNRKYRILAYCLPKFIRMKFRWLVRKPPAKVGKVVTTGL